MSKSTHHNVYLAPREGAVWIIHLHEKQNELITQSKTKEDDDHHTRKDHDDAGSCKPVP